MFEKVTQTAIDHDRQLSITFHATGNRLSGERECAIGCYDNKKDGIKFFFDSLLYFRGPKMKIPSKFEGTVGYIFLDQILKKYLKILEEKGSVSVLSNDLECSIIEDFNSAFRVIYFHLFDNRPSIHKLRFLNSAGIVFESKYDILMTPDGHPIQFSMIDVGSTRKLFQKDWSELTGGIE